MNSDVIVKIGADITGLNRGLDKAGNSINKFSDKIARRMQIAGTALVGASAAIGASALKMAGDFDGAMREVNTMMQLSEEEFKDFSKEIKAASSELGVSAVGSAKALYQAISAGIPKENVVDFLKVATKAAIGGVTDTVTAVDGLTTVINAFKIPVKDAQRVADIMFTTVKGGKTTFEELSASLYNVSPIAAAIGVKFETVAAALATMTAQGVPTAQATTQLRQAMVALSKPTDEMKNVIQELGFASGQAMLQELGFAKTINLLRDAAKGNNEQLMKMFGSVEAGQAILALTGQNAEAFANSLGNMENSAGMAQSAFEEMEKSTARRLEKLRVSLQNIAITIGEALLPAFQAIMNAIGPIIEKVGKWISEHPKLTAALLASIAAIGVILIIIPKLIALIGILKGITIVWTGVQWALNAAMSANPIGLVILAIAGLIAIIVLAIKHFDKIKAAFEAVGKVFKTVINAIVGFFKNMVDAIKTVFWKIVDIVLAPIRKIVNGVIKGINTVIGLVNKLPGIELKTIGWEFPEFAKKMQKGGIVTKPTTAIIGERGPEAVIPLNNVGALGATINVTVNGSVVTERELADVIYNQLITKKRYNAVLELS